VLKHKFQSAGKRYAPSWSVCLYWDSNAVAPPVFFVDMEESAYHNKALEIYTIFSKSK
jgi:hypothetical protein